MQKQPSISIRFDTKSQVERIKKAAKARKWSFNRFVVEASAYVSKLVETGALSEQLTDGPDRPPLNQ